MDVFIVAGQRMFFLSLFIATGFILSYFKLLKASLLKWMADSLYGILLPIVIFNSFYTSFRLEILLESVRFVCFFVLSLVIALAIGLVYGKCRKTPALIMGPLLFSGLFLNSGYISLSLVQTLFSGPNSMYADERALLYNTLAIIINNLFIGFTGNLVMTWFAPDEADRNKPNLRQILINPPLIGFLLGVICYILKLQLPGAAAQTLSLIGRATPLWAMIVLGAMLCQCHWKTIFGDIEKYILSVIRLLATPLLLFLIARLFGGDQTLLLSLLIITGAPVVAIMPVFAKRNGMDANWGSGYTFLSTLLSMITLPLLITFVTML